jgi:hypothetical protein
MPVEMFGKELLAELDAFLLAHVRDALSAPHIFGALNDERAQTLVKAVTVRLEPAVRCLFKKKSERIKNPFCAEPDVLAVARINVWLKLFLVTPADGAVNPVRCNDEIGVRELVVAGCFPAKGDLCAQLFGAIGQDIEEGLPRDATKAVSARADDLACEVDVDIIPAHEMICDLVVGLLIGGAEVIQRAVGEYDTPSKRVSPLIPLYDRNVVGGVPLQHLNGKIETGRTAADDGYLHRSLHPLSDRRAPLRHTARGSGRVSPEPVSQVRSGTEQVTDRAPAARRPTSIVDETPCFVK